MKTQVIAFDLDDTLLDTSQLLIPVQGRPEFYERIQKPLPMMDGAEENLIALHQKYHLVLITQGEVKVQKQKIQSLNCEKYFRKIYLIDLGKGEHKREAFQKTIQDFSVAPQSLLSIGNRRATDLRPAKILGAQTCLFLYGEHRNTRPEEAEDIPDFEVRSHRELMSVCKL